MEQMHDWQRLTEIPGKEKRGEHTGCNEAITFGKEMNNKEGTILSIKGERLILMPLNRKVILDWDTAQRSHNLSLPAEGDVDESQDWCVKNGQARTYEVDWQDVMRRHVCNHFLFLWRWNQMKATQCDKTQHLQHTAWRSVKLKLLRIKLQFDGIQGARNGKCDHKNVNGWIPVLDMMHMCHLFWRKI